MVRNKKVRIIYKIIGFMVLVSIITISAILAGNLFSNNSLADNNDKSKITDSSIGHETFENIKRNNIKLSCGDAKKLGEVFIQINKEMLTDNISNMQMNEYATSSPAKRLVDNFTDNFISFLENFYGQNNLSQAEAVLQAVNLDIYTNIVQTSLMINTGNISEKEFYDYLNIEYCGVTPPASYISPKDMVLYSINNSTRPAIEELMDNTNK